MSGALITSIFAVAIGIILIVAGDNLAPFLSFFPSDVGSSIRGGFGLMPLLGVILIALGVVFFIFGVLLKAMYRKKPSGRAREVIEKKIYVCPFDGAKFDSEEALDSYIKENYQNVIDDRKRLDEALSGDDKNG